MNKLLKDQLRQYLGETFLVPEHFRQFFQIVSETYDFYEEDRQMAELSVEEQSQEMAGLNNQLRKEKRDLKDAHGELEMLFEDIDEVLYSVDMATNQLTRLSPGCEKVYGYAAADFIADGQLWQKIVHPEDGHIAEMQKSSLASGKQVLNQYRIIHKDGSTRWVENKVIPTLDAARHLTKISGVTSDITGRKQIETQLEESVSLLEATLESTADGIVVMDKQARLVRFNKKFVELWRIPASILAAGDTEKAIAYVSGQLVNPDDFVSKIKELLSRQNENSHDMLHFKDGRIFERYSQPQQIKGEYAGRVWSFRDVTEQRHAELDLIKRETQLAIAAQMAKLGYWEFDAVQEMFTFTDQFYAIFRTTAEQVGGYTLTPEQYMNMFVYIDDRHVVGQEVALAMSTEDAYFSHELEHRIVYADGQMGYISVHFYVVKDEAGKTIRTFGVNQDITERKKTEEALRQSETDLEMKNQELELKNQELEQFAYVASHDLQEPLRTTSNFSEMLRVQYQGQLDENADKYLYFIKDSSDRMKVLIKDLLDYSRIGIKEELKKVDCNRILGNVIDDLNAAIQETKAGIHIGPLPVFNGYPTEIKRLFQNLILNAIKFRKKDTLPEVHISAGKDDMMWTFTVRDNGIGIDKDHQQRVFDIFQRLHTQAEYKGSGIGLANCKKIVTLHGGKIWVESVLGEGATFYFTIPEIWS